MLAGGADSLDRRPLISYTACWTVSPLRYATETVEILDRIVAQRLPVVISSAPQAGATAPAALAGTLVQITAEQLSGFVYVNLLNPGPPLIMGCVDRKSVVSGKSVSVRVYVGGGRTIKKTKYKEIQLST